MTSEQAEKLYQMILKSYGELNYQQTVNIMESLALNQFVIKIKKGAVEWFAAYWKLTDENKEIAAEGVRPLSIIGGKNTYIVEAVVKNGMRGMITALRKKAGTRWAGWHRALKKNKYCKAPQ